MKNAASIDTERKLERRACFASFRGIFLKLRTVSFETLAEKLKAPFALHKKQGCRRQPCFMHSANCTYSFSDEVKKLKVRSQKNEPRNKTKQARLSSLRSVSIGAALFTSASKT